MQTYAQTFVAAATWALNVPGKYFTLMGCANSVNVRFFKGGQKLALGDVSGIFAGLEALFADFAGEAAFDRVEIDVQAGDTVTVGIGNGQVRYNRSQGNVAVTSAVPSRSAFANTAKTVTSASAQLVAANASRSYLLIQNNDAAGILYVNFGAGAATAANGVKIPPGGSYELNANQSNTAVQAIGDIASNANVVVVEG